MYISLSSYASKTIFDNWLENASVDQSSNMYRKKSKIVNGNDREKSSILVISIHRCISVVFASRHFENTRKTKHRKKIFAL